MLVEQGLNKRLSPKRDSVRKYTSPMILSQDPCNHTLYQALSTNALPAFSARTYRWRLYLKKKLFCDICRGGAGTLFINLAVYLPEYFSID